jgi:PAS domain S-box-containing protein
MNSSASISSENVAKQRPKLRLGLLFAGAAALCYLAATLGGALAIRAPEPLWPLWPACALLVAILLLSPQKIWPVLIPAGLVGFTVYDLQVGLPIRAIAWFMFSDASEIVVAAWGVHYFLKLPPRLNSLSALAKYSLGVILAPLAASFMGIHSLDADQWIRWKISFLSESLAFLSITPAVLGWFGPSRRSVRASRGSYLELAVLIVVLTGWSYVIFVERGASNPPAILYSLVPLLVWSALGFGSTGVSTSVTIIALLSIWGAVHGRGPFTESDSVNRVLSLQLFLLGTSVPFMLLAVLVEERKQAEIELRESAKQLRSATKARLRLASLVESSDDSIVGTSIDGIITDWNKGAENLYGYGVDEVVGRSISLLASPDGPHDSPDLIEKLRGGDTVKNYETWRQTKVGKRIQVSLTVSPVKDWEGQIVGTSAISRDVSERNRLEAVLRESEERFRLVANTAPVLIWMAGTDKLCTFFNQGWLDFTGRSIEQELGEGWISDVHPDDVKHCLSTYSTSFDNRVDFEFEYRLRRYDGEYRWIVDYGVPRFELDGTFCGYIGSGVDITERKSMAEALRALTGRLIHAQEQERSRIARELHDDFNQRLAVQCIELAKLHKTLSGSETPEHAKVLEMIKRTRQMASDLRSLSHQLHSSKLHLIGLAPAVHSLCQEVSEKHGIQVRFRQSGVLRNLPKDAALCLFRITQEALSNVVKHSAARSADVELDVSTHCVTLRIVDQGRGFDPDVKRADAGIGLVGMRERLRLVDGNLQITSELMRGTHILAEIPLAVADDDFRVRAVGG